MNPLHLLNFVDRAGEMRDINLWEKFNFVILLIQKKIKK